MYYYAACDVINNNTIYLDLISKVFHLNTKFLHGKIPT